MWKPRRTEAPAIMTCTHQTETETTGTIDTLEDSESGLRIRIHRTGAEMVSLARRSDTASDWVGFLHRDNETSPPSSGWANHATVMGYFVHRLVDERSEYRDATITGGNHGFLRHFEFEAPEFDAARCSLTYRVAADAIPPNAYPLRVPMALTYRLTDSAVEVEFTFTNEERELEAHLSFGVHPGFAVSSISEADVILPRGTYIRHWAPGNFLDGRQDAIAFEGGPMPFAKEDLPGSYLLGISGVPERHFTLRDVTAGREVNLHFGDCPYLTIWSDGGPFICLEPCWGLADSRPQRPFQEKVGIQRIPAGQKLQASFRIEPRIL